MTEVWRGTWVVGYRELLRFVNERSRMIGSFAQPLIFLVIFGAGFGNLIGSVAPGVDFIQFMYPGIIAMGVLTTSLFAGVSVVWDREFGFLRELLVAPIGRTGIVLGKAAGAAVVALLQVALMLLIAPIVGVDLDVGIIVLLVPIVFILSIALSGLGLLVASYMRSQQGFQLLIQLLIFPLIFLAGVFFPINQAPEWLQVISKFNPLTYGVDAIRQVFLGSDAGPRVGVTVLGHVMTLGEEVLIIGAFAVVLITAAAWSFNRQE
ncbi:MAG TPA: ABC transporter permease [Candidatus Limnocylindria bacterium]|jgi:ABC-2 type transport system permease protein|nr:ABC transporter permease [Candidatus Limnocylindria bacterium]